MIVFQGRLLRTGEVWFDGQPSDVRVDLIRYMYRPEPVPGADCRESHTLVVDLSREPDEILAAMTKDTRYEIRRAAEKDKVTSAFHFTDATAVLPRFFEFFDRFATTKGIAVAPRARLKIMAEAGALGLTHASDPDGNDLVWHAYFRGPRRVRLLHSGSVFRESADNAFRNLVGRANRYLHWQDMLRLKACGMVQYDFGGYYVGDSHEDFLRVNQFKQEFGGTVERNYICEQRVSLKARVVYAAARLLGKIE